jgi:dihydroneopterin aldolase
VVDRIVLSGIRAWGRHGVSEDERVRAQEFEVELACAVDAAEAARVDDMAATVDYRRLRAIAVEEMENSSYRLLETLAEHIASRVLGELGTTWVRVKVTKLRIPASVEIERHR